MRKIKQMIKNKLKYCYISYLLCNMLFKKKAP
jgi:hypothetical protein